MSKKDLYRDAVRKGLESAINDEDVFIVMPKPVYDKALSAIVETEEIGKGTKIWHFAHISKGVEIGRDCTIGEGVYIGPNVKIGIGCKIQNHAQIFEGVEIGDHVFIGPCVCFTNDKHPTCREYFTPLPTKVISHAVIGANSTILPGITIDGFVAAGSVVTKDVKTRVKGNPAREY